MFSNSDIKDYIVKFFPLSEEQDLKVVSATENSDTDSFTTDSESVQGYHSSNEARSEGDFVLCWIG
jgi:hypothetical protein